MRAIFDRVLNEPALLVAVVLAVGNLVGHDLGDVANLVESLLVVVGGVIIRQQVTPVRSL
jgi:hypothetical protein